VIPVDGDSAAAVEAIKAVFPFEAADSSALETVQAEER